jgi:large conductance mechanosensitive channel
MGILKEFRDFALKGNVVDLAVAVIIGGAFGLLVTSMVNDVLMPPIGKMAGNLDFSNMYISLSSVIDEANTAKAAEVAATQPATDEGVVGAATAVFDTKSRLPLEEARKLGPVIAYGKFITNLINFVIVAFCVFILVKMMNTAKKRLESEQVGTPPPALPADVALLTEIRDILKAK